MKLLFDQNLSPQLVTMLTDIYPGCQHVRNLGLKEAADTAVWDRGRLDGFTIVSKDSDFHQRSLVWGFPPKIIWVKLGNCPTAAVEQILRVHLEDVQDFEADETAAFLILS